jgi:hypothetical protein
LEAVHDIVYFTPSASTAYADIGCRGWWMGYFASRAAALGPVGPDLVTAVFFGFAPGKVARAIPDAWRFADPAAVLATRQRIAVDGLQRIVSGAGSGPSDGRADVAPEAAGGGGVVVPDEQIRALSELTGRMVAAAPRAGRPLFAAHAGLPRPDDPTARLWFDATALREFRGDGHVAALVTAGLTGCSANRLMFALGLVPANQRERRGWSEEEWEQAHGELLERGWLHGDGTPTAAGQAAREEIEHVTDRLCEPATSALGLDEVEFLRAGIRQLAAAVAGSGVIPYPNPTGVPSPLGGG